MLQCLHSDKTGIRCHYCG